MHPYQRSWLSLSELASKHPSNGTTAAAWRSSSRSRVGEDHRASSASSIDVDNPTLAHADATSTSSSRLLHRDQTGGDVGSTTAEMVRAGSSTHSPVGGRRPVPRHDRQRAADSTADSFKEGHELRSRAPELARPSVDELSPVEVCAEVTHRRRTRDRTPRCPTRNHRSCRHGACRRRPGR